MTVTSVSVLADEMVSSNTILNMFWKQLSRFAESRLLSVKYLLRQLSEIVELIVEFMILKFKTQVQARIKYLVVINLYIIT